MLGLMAPLTWPPCRNDRAPDKNTKTGATLLDGYNLIHADADLSSLAQRNLAMARAELDTLAMRYSVLTKTWWVGLGPG